ncbi:hypothetical protein [Glycomyces buryatensis]|uniref:YbaB/EbfC family nucleoid-associated protein n=1 Tax=Glycomyces buryatensis TaxID=2570927 RepID=A0A4S8QAY8_9ACTN|nr:hypothetical protein [Glycomyces buryatensis]THV41430.1 hypothetical protein FAB82_11570 [Glycomyces buryatensis]
MPTSPREEPNPRSEADGPLGDLASLLDFDPTGLDQRISESIDTLRELGEQGMDIDAAMRQLQGTPTEAFFAAQRAEFERLAGAMDAFNRAEYRGVDPDQIVAVTIDVACTVTRTELLDGALRCSGPTIAAAVVAAFAAAEAELSAAAERLNPQ